MVTKSSYSELRVGILKTLQDIRRLKGPLRDQCETLFSGLTHLNRLLGKGQPPTLADLKLLQDGLKNIQDWVPAEITGIVNYSQQLVTELEERIQRGEQILPANAKHAGAKAAIGKPDPESSPIGSATKIMSSLNVNKSGALDLNKNGAIAPHKSGEVTSPPPHPAEPDVTDVKVSRARTPFPPNSPEPDTAHAGKATPDRTPLPPSAPEPDAPEEPTPPEPKH